LTHPDTQRWLRPPPLEPIDRTGALERLCGDIAHWEEHGFGPWALADRRDGGFVGRGGLAWTDVAGERAVELPWSLMPARRGEGLATEAAAAALALAADLEITEVVSFTLVDNEASRRVMERIGLVFDRQIEHAGLPPVLYRATTGSGRRSA